MYLVSQGIGIILVSLESATSCPLYVYVGHLDPVCWYATNLMFCRYNVLPISLDPFQAGRDVFFIYNNFNGGIFCENLFSDSLVIHSASIGIQ